MTILKPAGELPIIAASMRPRLIAVDDYTATDATAGTISGLQ